MTVRIARVILCAAGLGAWTAPAQPQPPTIREQGVVNAASGEPVLCPGCRILIRGQNLASESLSVTPDTLVEGAIPVELGGVKVQIHELALPLVSVSPEAVEAIVPWEVPMGHASLEIVTAGGRAAVPVEVQPYAPAFYPADNGGADLRDSAGNPVTVLNPLDTVSASLNGLGPAEPAVPAGQWPSQPVPLRDASLMRLFLGQTAAEIVSASLAGPGRYNVTFKAPFAAPGELPMTLRVAGETSPPVPVTMGRHPGATLSISSPSVTLQVVERASATQQLRVGSGVAGLPVRVSATTAAGGAWLSASLSAATAPATLTLTVNAANLLPGNYQGEVSLASDAAGNTPLAIPVTAVVSASKVPRITGISPDPLPAGRAVSYFTIFGSNMDAVTSIELDPGAKAPPSRGPSGSRGMVSTSLQLNAISAVETRMLRVTSPEGTSDPFPVRVAPVVNGPEPKLLSVSPAEFPIGTRVRLTLDTENVISGRVEVAPADGITVNQSSLELDVSPNAAPGFRTLRVTVASGASNSVPVYLRKPEPELTAGPRVLWPGRIYHTADKVSPTGIGFQGIDLNRPAGVVITPEDGVSATSTDTAAFNNIASILLGAPEHTLIVRPDATPGLRRLALRTQGGTTNSLAVEVRPASDKAPILDEVSVVGIRVNSSRSVTVTVRFKYRDPDGDMKLAGTGIRSGLYVSPHPALRVSRLSTPAGFRDVGANTVEIQSFVSLGPFSPNAITNPALVFWLVDDAGNPSNFVEVKYTGLWPYDLACLPPCSN